jgi:hypothetical protein
MAGGEERVARDVASLARAEILLQVETDPVWLGGPGHIAATGWRFLALWLKRPAGKPYAPGKRLARVVPHRASLALLALLAVSVAELGAADMRFVDEAVSPQTLAAETEQAEFTAIVAIECSTFAAFGQTGQATITLSATADRPGIRITGPMSYAVDTAGCLGATEVQVPVALQVAASSTAPGETPIRITVRADLISNQVGQSSATAATTQATISVKPSFLCEVKVPTTIQSAGAGERIPYPIEIRNLGNTLVSIKFNVLNEPTGGYWKPVAPTELVLQSTQQGGTETTRTVEFLVFTPQEQGLGSSEKAFQLEVVAASTKDGSQGPCGTVNVLARKEGFPVEAPGPLLPAVAVALALALALRRRA